MRVIITTLGRVNSQTTLLNLPPSIRARTQMVVQAHELEMHADKWGEVCDVMPLPDWIDNLGPTRQWLVDTYRGEKLVLLDDDLTFYVRPNRDDWRLRGPTEANIEELFYEIECKLDDYAHVGVSGREGNNRVTEYGSETTRYMRVLAWNTALWPETVRCDRVNGMSDFDTNLQLLRAGLPSYVFSHYAQGQDGTQTPGGCALNRTHDTHTAEVHKLVEMHPGLVRPVEKKNKTGGEFGQRTEAVIAWKQALAEGLRSRETKT